jgi:MurNAc alpha-1-phosphate uridylyltransferase
MKNHIDQSFILAAGMGTRLRPYTDTVPKPMVHVAGRAIIDYALDKLSDYGVENTVINLYHRADILEKYLRDRKSPNIRFSHENILLETGGGVKNALFMMRSAPFFLLNGDALWEDGAEKSALQRLAEAFDEDRMDILLLLQPIEKMHLTQGVGDYDLDEPGHARRRKSRDGALMFTGIRLVHPRVFENAPEGAFSFLALMDAAEKAGRLHGIVHDGDWHHISTPDNLNAVNRAFTDRERAG